MILLPVHCPSSNCHLLVFNLQQSHNEGVFLYQAGWITDLCIHSSCRKCPLLRKSMLRIPGASEPVTIQCFCHLSPVKLTSASNTDNSWHPLVTPEIQMGSTLLCLDGITNTHQLSAKALYLCGSDVPSHQIHTVQGAQSSLSPSWPKAGTLYSCSRSEYSGTPLRC